MKIPLVVYAIFTNKRFLIGFIVFIIILFMGLAGPLIYGRDPFAKGPRNQPPSLEYPLGTDGFGRDVFAQFLYSIRVSLTIGLLTAVIAMSIGLTIGSIAGIKGGIVDEILMSVTNVFLAIPNWLVAVLIASYLPPEARGPHIIAITLGAFTWPWFARAIRAQFMSLREREFVSLSKMAGYGDIRIVFEDLIPIIGPYIVTAFAIFMAIGIAGEAGLALILSTEGMAKHLSLGMMLFWANYFLAYVTGAWWLFLPPGLTIVALSTSLSLIAIGLENIFNPRLRES
ncbi:MAG: ABC transporter permease [Ignisphaera sp.]